MTFLLSSHYKKRHNEFHREGGFTLLELLVVMGVMLVITTLILARHNQFNGTVLVRNLSYSVALSIRQAQVYGLSGRSTGGLISIRYGVYFTSANPTQYVLFADQDSDGTYDPGESVEVFSLSGGYVISNICANTGTVEKCSGSGDIDRLTILFMRPNPDARFITDIANDVYTNGTITVLSAQGVTRYVRVTTTGQISVQQE